MMGATVIMACRSEERAKRVLFFSSLYEDRFIHRVIAPDKRSIQKLTTVFLLLHKHKLRIASRGDSNVYQQRLFSWRNKTYIPTFYLKKKILPNQLTHNVVTTSLRRRGDVMTSPRRRSDAVTTLCVLQFSVCL